MIDAEGRIVLVNREVERLFGYSREELLGHPIEVLVPARFRGNHGGFRSGFQRAPRVRAMGAGRDLYGLRRDGSEVPVEIGLTPVATEEGLFVLAAVVDISTRKEAEADRRRLEEQLRQAQKMEAIGTLAGGIAHDFNNILSSILGYAELLQPTVAANAVASGDLASLLSAAERGKDLITRILQFSRRQTAERQPLDLARCLAEANSLLRATLPAGVEIKVDLPPEPARVAANATSIHQVVMNLATNAVHAMDNGGTLGLTVEPVYLRDSMAAAHPDLHEGPYIRLSVSDTGKGIEPALLERVFEPFFTTKPPGSGSGLGLSMVHGIMRDHEGVVLITSELGRGTRVQCYFPALESEATETTVDAEDTPEGNGERVLVVDDERSLATLGERRLVELGYEATSLTDPVAALEYVRQDPEGVDLVITDFSMPRMSGLELARAIQTIRPGLPILLTSGFSEGFPEGVQDDAGIRHVLTKPTRMHELAVAVRSALGDPPKPN